MIITHFNLQVMKRDRFTLVLRFLHLNDNSQYKKGEPGHDPLYKLRPFLSPLIAHFQSSYTLHREVSIDKSMIGFKVRLGFIQYVLKKPTKWRMKAFVLSDAQTAYMFNWHLYTGMNIYVHCMKTCECVYMYVCVYVCACVCVCTYGCVWRSLLSNADHCRLCACTCMYVYMCVYA